MRTTVPLVDGARQPSAAELAEVKAEYEAAVSEADATGGTVHGGYRRDGRPFYWVQPPDEKDPEGLAFEMRHGRRPDAERQLMVIAKGSDLYRWRLAAV